jgi:hydroxymethylglutaryl-CoA reductase (NADPH)
MTIPSLMLKQLYNFGSLRNTDEGVEFWLKNRFNHDSLSSFSKLKIDDLVISPESLYFDFGDGNLVNSADLPADKPTPFPPQQRVRVLAKIDALETGIHTLSMGFTSVSYGELEFSVDDTIAKVDELRIHIPRDRNDDYGEDIIKKRQEFVKEFTGAELKHIPNYSFDPHTTQGNVEHFTGVAQVPIGLAGPLKMNGEHAIGEFLIPLATTEGTLIASYNRGIKVLNLCGGAKCTIVGDAMQRAPVFVFEDARAAREFVRWVEKVTPKIRTEAESTSSVAKLQYIDSYLSNKFVYLRFNYSTGDAAGQNMVGRATFVACSWILDHYQGIRHFFLESNFATDKKASQINIMRTRGKRVTAEVTIPSNILVENMRVRPETLAYHSQVAQIGSFISGANNNGLHSANGITAMFIATGQDVANVSESSAGILYTELTPHGDLYISITIPSLIVATFGGGTGLATQRESLEILGCVGRGKVNKLAEIIAGVVLAGEISLGSAISALDWVSSHEQYGRNR